MNRKRLLKGGGVQGLRAFTRSGRSDAAKEHLARYVKMGGGGGLDGFRKGRRTQIKNHPSSEKGSRTPLKR